MDDRFMEKLGDALRDENGLLPTEAARSVLVTVVAAIDTVDLRWSEQERAGAPSTTDYAAGAILTLRKYYSTSAVTL
jgi:hypothetical protein